MSCNYKTSHNSSRFLYYFGQIKTYSILFYCILLCSILFNLEPTEPGNLGLVLSQTKEKQRHGGLRPQHVHGRGRLDELLRGQRGVWPAAAFARLSWELQRLGGRGKLGFSPRQRPTGWSWRLRGRSFSWRTGRSETRSWRRRCERRLHPWTFSYCKYSTLNKATTNYLRNIFTPIH